MQKKLLAVAAAMVLAVAACAVSPPVQGVRVVDVKEQSLKSATPVLTVYVTSRAEEPTLLYASDAKVAAGKRSSEQDGDGKRGKGDTSTAVVDRPRHNLLL